MNEQIRSAVAESLSSTQALTLLNKAATSGNVRWLKAICSDNQISTTHWCGRTRTTTCHSDLCAQSLKLNFEIKKFIRSNNLLHYICSVCKLPPTWNGSELVLRLDHINGVRNDHRLENLRFVCPNCDSQLPTFGARNRKRRDVIPPQCKCGRVIGKKSTRCARCAQKSKVSWSSIPSLIEEVEVTSMSAVGRRIGVSDNAVRKKIKQGLKSNT